MPVLVSVPTARSRPISTGSISGDRASYLYIIVAAYLVAATIFALCTPAWQNPDEPAHYNNIAHIASGVGLPVLHMGDYNQEYLGQLVQTRFPAELSIAPLRYESYQPPLYYVAAAPVYWVTQGNLTAIRLFNVMLGAITIVLLYLCVELVFPTKPLLSVGAAAFAAFLPMHVAMNAAVNNDGLAELLLLAAMLAVAALAARAILCHRRPPGYSRA